MVYGWYILCYVYVLLCVCVASRDCIEMCRKEHAVVYLGDLLSEISWKKRVGGGSLAYVGRHGLFKEWEVFKNGIASCIFEGEG